MLDQFITFAQGLIVSAGFLGVVVLAFIPEIIPPIPSALIPMTAGFAFLADAPFSWASFGTLFWKVGVPVSLGLTAGALVVYYIVYWGGKPIVIRYGRYVGVAWHDIEQIQTYLDTHSIDDALLLFGRLMPFVPSVVVNVFCGLVRWPFGSFLLYTSIGTIGRAMIMGFVGWQFATVYLHYAKVVEHTQGAIVALIVVAIAWFIYHRRKKK